MTDKEINLVDEWSSECFENYPLILENPFDRGDIVMDEDKVGVIDITKEEMEIHNERVRNGMITEYSKRRLKKGSEHYTEGNPLSQDIVRYLP